MTDKQPEALRLANVCSNLTRYSMDAHLIAAELLRQHAENETLRAGYAAARLEIESLKAQQPGAVYAELPEPHHRGPAGTGNYFSSFTADQMRAFADATCAMRASHGQAPAQAAPAAVAGPVVNRATVIEWLDANDIEVTDRQMDGLFHFAAPTTQPSPAVQGDALSDEAVRVPLDSLHADAAYLIGRLREGSMPYARVIEIIRERIDAAKAAIRARAAQGDALDAARYRFLRDGEWRDTDLEPFIRLQLNTLWDANIDAARAAQEGEK